MSRPLLQKAPIQYGLYGLVNQDFPERAARMDEVLGSMASANMYCILRAHLHEMAVTMASSLSKADTLGLFTEHLEDIPRSMLPPDLPIDFTVGWSATMWRDLLLGKRQGDVPALINYSYIHHMFSLEVTSEQRPLMEFERLMLTSMTDMLKPDLPAAFVDELFLKMQEYTINPPFSYNENCSLFTKLTTALSEETITLLLRFPISDIIPNVASRLRVRRESNEA